MEQEQKPSGFLLIDKPTGITSHDVIDKLRKITGIRKIGHAGTLDPFATGLLIVAIGRKATKEISSFVGMDKIYDSVFVIGATTETLDPESEVIKSEQISKSTSEQVENAMQLLTGDIEQIPPMYSAIKIKGKKLYELARKGKEVERKARNVTIHSFDPTNTPFEENDLIKLPVQINCSSGTYIRALARDLAEKLETKGYVESLRRISIDNYSVNDSKTLNELSSSNWQKSLFQIDSNQNA